MHGGAARVRTPLQAFREFTIPARYVVFLRACSRAFAAAAARVHPLSVLIGLAAGWQWCGLRMILSSAIDPSPDTAVTIGAIALLAAALGPWLPQCVVLRAAGFIETFKARREQRGHVFVADDRSASFWMIRAIHERDEPLLWLSLSVLASVAGILSLLTLALARMLSSFYGEMLAQFFWTHLTLAVLQWLVIGLVIGASWVINGLVLAALVPVLSAGSDADAYRPRVVSEWDSADSAECRNSHHGTPTIVAGVLVGLGAAWLIQRRWAEAGKSGQQIYLLGVLPMFLLAAFTAWRCQCADRTRQTPSVENEPPELTESGEHFIWLLLVVWGAASVLTIAGWLRCAGDGNTSHVGIGGYLLMLGIGVTAATFHTRRSARSASGCGMALWAAGVGSAAAATLSASGRAAAASAIFQLAIIALPIGYALHYAERAWMARASRASRGFGQLMTAVLGGAAIGLLLVNGWALPQLGPVGTMTVGSLMMLAFGGFVQIYEQERPLHSRHQRLSLVFASLAAAIAIFPGDVRRWADWERSQLEEPASFELDSGLVHALSSARNVCLIGVEPVAITPALTRPDKLIHVIPFASRSVWDGGIKASSRKVRIETAGAIRVLQCEHRRQDLIYQRCSGGGAMEHFGEYSLEWFRQLAAHTSPAGALVVDFPLAGSNRETIAVIAATFTQAAPGVVSWTTMGAGDRSFLRLHAGASAPDSSFAEYTWSPIESLLNDGTEGPAAVHSLNGDALTRAYRIGAVDRREMLAWLDRCRVTGLAAVRSP